MEILVALIPSIITALIGYFVGKKQSDDNWQRELDLRKSEHKEEMQILRNQLEEQKKQRELNERVLAEQKSPKFGLYNLNANKNPESSSSKKWKDQ